MPTATRINSIRVGISGHNLSTGDTVNFDVKKMAFVIVMALVSVIDVRAQIVAPPAVPVLVSPMNGAINQPVNLALSWSTSANAATYAVQVSTISGFGSTVTAQIGLPGTSASISGLANNTTYYWRAGAKNIAGVSGWSGAWSFSTSSHFVVPNKATGSNMLVLVRALINPTINGSALQKGDEIGVFNNTGRTRLCVGATVWTGANASITVWGQNPEDSTTVDGMAPGEVLVYRLWDAVHSTEMAAGATYLTHSEDSGVTSDSTYVNNGLSKLASLVNIPPPGVPVLAMPTNASGNVSITPTLSWNSVNTAVSYHLNVSVMSNFSTTVYDLRGLTGTAQALSGLANSTTYYWEVGASNVGGVSGWSGSWSFTTIVAAPSAPVLALPSNGAGNQPISSLGLSWGSSALATSYEVEVSLSSGFGSTLFDQSGVLTNATVNGLANSTTYYWRANASNVGGTSWSNAWSFTTIVAAPGAPVLALPSNGAGNQPISSLGLSWGSSALATSYEVEVSLSSGFGSTLFDQSGVLTNATVNGLANSTTYYWRANASNVGGTSWSNAWSFTTIVAAPGAPVLASPSNGAGNQPISSLGLSWGSSALATSYEVEVSLSSGFGSTLFDQSGVLTNATVNGLTNSTTYYWRANASNVGGTSWSNAWSFTTIVAAPGAPVLASPSNGAGNQPISSLGLSWGSSALATSYEVEVSLSSGFGSTLFDQSGVLTSATVNGLANSTTYYWRANASNVGGTSWSNAWSFTTIVAAPGVPVLVSPSNGAGNQPISSLGLSWGSSALATSYEVEVSLSSGFGSTLFDQSGVLTNATVNGLANSTTYYWRANASNVGGTSWSNAWSFTTIVAAPGAPVLASPSNGAGNQPISSLGLSWGSSALATSYEVEVSLSSGFGSTLFDQSGVLTNATVNGLANSTTYYWRANASNVGGTSWSNAWSFTTIVAAPGVPVLVSPSNGAGNQPISSLGLSWGSSALATSYEVEVSLSSGFGSTLFDQSGVLTNATVNGLANSTTYYWRANASNVGGTSWSNAWSFTTIVAAPGVPVLASPSNGAGSQPVSLSLSWNTSANAATYAVQVSTDAAFGSTVAAQIGLTGTMASISGLGNSATYYWRVGAKDAGGVSGWSGAWSFTTVIALPDVPQLSSPASGAIAQPVTLSLNWGASARAAVYALQVSTASNFGSTVVSQTSITATTFPISGLGNNVTYYWKVLAVNLGGSVWSSTWSFTTLINFSLPIDAGWNMISLNIRPADSTPEAVFGDSTTVRTEHYPKGFLLVKDCAGNSYWPTIGINDLGTLHTGEGYQIYSDLKDTVRTVGSAIPAFTTPISLNKEWNLIAYLPQINLPIDTALIGIIPKIEVVKDNAGEVFWPYYGINNIGTMVVGQGYLIYMTDPATLIYDSIPSLAKETASVGARQMLRLPSPRHYAKHANTGNNASVLASRVTFSNQAAPDSCEIGAFDENGNLVGSGTVIHGLAAFPVWGTNTQIKRKDGLGASEKITFKLWNKNNEYPVEFKTSDGSEVRYTAQAIFLGSLSVPEGALIKVFNLSKAYPNPFRGVVHIAFDVPMINGIAERNISLNIYDLKGRLVEQLAKGIYKAGHYTIQWNASADKNGGEGSSVYIVRMQADKYDKRLKMVRLRD